MSDDIIKCTITKVGERNSWWIMNLITKMTEIIKTRGASDCLGGLVLVIDCRNFPIFEGGFEPGITRCTAAVVTIRPRHPHMHIHTYTLIRHMSLLAFFTVKFYHFSCSAFCSRVF